MLNLSHFPHFWATYRTPQIEKFKRNINNLLRPNNNLQQTVFFKLSIRTKPDKNVLKFAVELSKRSRKKSAKYFELESYQMFLDIIVVIAKTKNNFKTFERYLN